MAENNPSSPTNPSSGPAVFLVAAVGLVLLFGAVALGWKLSRLKPDGKPVLVVATPAPVAPPEKSTVTNVERQEVLQRIDLMPNVTAAVKERMYPYVERPQSLQRLVTVSFETSHTRVSEKEATRVVKESKKPPFASMARDPAAIFVVLGYADQGGEEKRNQQISTARAASVIELLQKRC